MTDTFQPRHWVLDFSDVEYWVSWAGGRNLSGRRMFRKSSERDTLTWELRAEGCCTCEWIEGVPRPVTVLLPSGQVDWQWDGRGHTPQAVMAAFPDAVAYRFEDVSYADWLWARK